MKEVIVESTCKGCQKNFLCFSYGFLVESFCPECQREQLREDAKSAYKKTPINNDDKWFVWERDNYTCRGCGSRRNLAVDHVVPESKGGANHPDNYQTLCKTCNSRKGAR